MLCAFVFPVLSCSPRHSSLAEDVWGAESFPHVPEEGIEFEGLPAGRGHSQINCPKVPHILSLPSQEPSIAPRSGHTAQTPSQKTLPGSSPFLSHCWFLPSSLCPGWPLCLRAISLPAPHLLPNSLKALPKGHALQETTSSPCAATVACWTALFPPRTTVPPPRSFLNLLAEWAGPSRSNPGSRLTHAGCPGPGG